jgi:1-acyl-sn-glycerol-3-phosphate acyltransferase
MMRLAGISVSVAHGAASKTPVVYVMNHASALDIVCVETLLGGAPRIWLGKHEYDKMPVLNWILKRMHVLVDAQSPTHAARALKVIQKQASTHAAHVLLFPEGARFDDGRIHRFFKGFSILAEVLDRDVVPIYIHNTHRVYPKNSFLIMSNELITLSIGAPMTRRKGQSHEEFTAQVREWFIERSQA